MEEKELRSFYPSKQSKINKVFDCNIEPPNDSTLLDLSLSQSGSERGSFTEPVSNLLNVEPGYSSANVISESVQNSFNYAEAENSDLDHIKTATNVLHTHELDGNKRRKFIKIVTKRKPSDANTGSRKRLRNDKDNIDRQAKKARAEGNEGIGRKSNPINARSIKDACLGTCRKKCRRNINESDRQTAFDIFWKLANKEKQWKCLNNWVVAKGSSNSSEDEACTSKRKSETVFYNFRLPSSDKLIPVCKTMFLNTLDISYQWLRTARKKIAAADVTGIIEGDKRGTHENRPHKYPEEMKNEVKSHIASFPTVDSHYCRETTQRKFLEEGLSIAKMHRMYVEQVGLGRDDSAIVSQSMYTSIFNTEFNLGFYTPKKDRCEQCENYKNSSPEEKAKKSVDYESHLKHKSEARRLMKEDKERALNDASVCCANYDMQKILTTPRSDVSTMYYKSKLSVWNFTIFQLGINIGICHLWNETIGNRGSNEISSFVWNFIRVKAESGTKLITFYTDNCAGQNRNQNLFSMYIWAAIVFGIQIIHRFLEVGHTQNDGDSMHARIEICARKKELFTQNEWATLMTACKTKGDPYEVKQLTQEDIYDFTDLSQKFNWKQVKISKVREIVISPQSKFVEIKHEFFKASNKYNFLKKNVTLEQIAAFKPKKAYNGRIPLAPKKNDDLQYMLTKNLIPKDSISDFKKMLNDEIT